MSRRRLCVIKPPLTPMYGLQSRRLEVITEPDAGMISREQIRLLML